MEELIDVVKIVDDMSDKYGLVLTKIERLYLEMAVLHGAIALNKKNGDRLKGDI